MTLAQARAATTANISLSGNVVFDGITTAPGDRILVKNQTTPSQNGVYIAASGAWSKAPDNPTVAGETIGISYGYVNPGTFWRFDGTTTWTQIGDSVTLATASTTGLTLTTSAINGPLATRMAGRGNQVETLTLGGILNSSSGGTGLAASGVKYDALISDGFGGWSVGAPNQLGNTGRPETVQILGTGLNLNITGDSNISSSTSLSISSSTGPLSFSAPSVQFTSSGGVAFSSGIGSGITITARSISFDNAASLRFKETGTEPFQGVATLSGGVSPIIASPDYSGTYRVFLTRQTYSANMGHLYLVQNNGNFYIHSSDPNDDSIVAWMVTLGY